MTKHVVSFDDLSVRTIENLFDLANLYYEKLKNKEPINICRDKIMATMFYEASTRTRMSFESAMFRLGGKVISSADTQTTSSAAKGESLTDTIKVVQNYADIIVLRHPKDGSTRLAAENSEVPLISGGDGAHEHPTQTLCDLFTIWKKKGTIKGLNVALCGDLRYGRTVHSLAYGLAKFGANISTVAPKDFELPEYVIHRLRSEYGVEVEKHRELTDTVERQDVQYLTPQKTPQPMQQKSQTTLPLSVTVTHQLEAIQDFDAVYITRIQMERIQDAKSNFEGMKSYLVNKELLSKAKDSSIVMHPLPRRDELAYDVDQDKRAAYFEQAAYGVPVRMALIASLLGVAGDFEFELEDKGAPVHIPKECSNSSCITQSQKNVETKYVRINGCYRCYYCDQEQEIQHISTQ